MLDFNHKLANFWAACGFPTDSTKTTIDKMAHFVGMFAENERMRELFLQTPNSYQVEFILTQILETNQNDPKDMFLAGHLLGSFATMLKKGMFNDTKMDEIGELMEDLLKKLKRDKGDF